MSLPSVARCEHCGGLLHQGGRRPLTQKQAAVLVFIEQFIEAHNFAPSLSEIARAFAYRSLATVHEHLQSLEVKGWIRRSYNEARAITLNEDRAA